jgi:flavin-dependent dehydrogenase
MAGLRPIEVEVLVLGGGPGGASASLALARVGVSVMLAERTAYDRFRIGETLPPRAKPLLARLGPAGSLAEAGHLPAPGIVAAWGSDVAHENDFIFSPHGHGWHLDRCRFDESLARAAAEAGAEWLVGARAVTCRKGDRLRWSIGLDTPAGPSIVGANWVIDATGRARWFARSRGVARRVYDRLIAVVAILDDAGRDDPRTFIEAMPDGWWYVSALPADRAIAAFFTDSDLHDLRPDTIGPLWDARLSASRLASRRIADARPIGAPRVVVCSTMKADRATGDGWLAVGDAARTIDPLSSQGISWAIASGLDAASLVIADDPTAATGHHEDEWEGRFRDYLTARRDYYASERRWPDSPFWRRRSARSEPLHRATAVSP